VTDSLTVKTGFIRFDSILGGFKSGGMYLVAGVKKSGKSSLVLNFVKGFISKGNSVCYASTELTEEDVELYNGKNWLSDNPGFLYTDIRLSPNLSDVVSRVEEILNNGDTKILILDNLTSFGLNNALGKEEWNRIAAAGDAFRKLAIKWNIVLLAVVHLNKGLRIREIPLSVKKLIQKGNPSGIFDESVSVWREPTSDDIKGGEAFKSQVFGEILLWRPYQDFELPEYNKLTQVIIEGGRYNGGGKIKYHFDGKAKTFTEIEEPTFEEAKQIFNPQYNND
jgi:hypothetical protein